MTDLTPLTINAAVLTAEMRITPQIFYSSRKQGFVGFVSLKTLSSGKINIL